MLILRVSAEIEENYAHGLSYGSEFRGSPDTECVVPACPTNKAEHTAPWGRWR